MSWITWCNPIFCLFFCYPRLTSVLSHIFKQGFMGSSQSEVNVLHVCHMITQVTDQNRENISRRSVCHSASPQGEAVGIWILIMGTKECCGNHAPLNILTILWESLSSCSHYAAWWLLNPEEFLTSDMQATRRAVPEYILLNWDGPRSSDWFQRNWKTIKLSQITCLAVSHIGMTAIICTKPGASRGV